MRLLTLITFAFLSLPNLSWACGGCFSPPDSVSTVTDHRMVVAISNTSTTLWDQIQYTGSPKDFVWVLPTPVPATVMLAEPAFFDELDRETAPQVFRAPQSRGTGSVGLIGCGASAPSQASGGEGDNVTVYHQGTVGPYETATIGSTDAMALTTWLNDHGYAVPPALDGTIAFYVNKHWVFNALRLRPDATTTQMQPVRVTFEGLLAEFPLRMVAAGAASEIGILLWVIADQRYESSNYQTITLDDQQLRWSTRDNKSNYREVFAATLAAHPQGAFVTEYAQQMQLYALSSYADQDLQIAINGLGGAQPWLTRLRTSISPSLLVDDLALAPEATGLPISNRHQLTAQQETSGPLTAGVGLLALLAVHRLLRRKRAGRI